MRHDTLTSRLAAAGARGLVRLAHWRGRREAEREVKKAMAPSFRGLIQINMIRS